MKIHPRQKSLRSLLIVSGVLVLFVGGFLLLGISRDAKAQNPDSPDGNDPVGRTEAAIDGPVCIDAVRLSCERIARRPGGDSILRYTCRVETVMADTAVPTSVADVHIAIGTERLQAVSEHFEFYRDSLSVFTVIPVANTIYRSDPDPVPEKDMFGNILNAEWMRDSILLKSQILECSIMTDSLGHTLQTIRLSPDPDIRYYLNVGEIMVVIDKDVMLPLRMTVVPMQPEFYKSVTWAFSDIRVEPITADYQKPLADLFDNGRGGLKPAWDKYTLVDNRCEALAAIIER